MDWCKHRLAGFRSRNAPASLKAGPTGEKFYCEFVFPEQKCSGFIEGTPVGGVFCPDAHVSGAEMLRLH